MTVTATLARTALAYELRLLAACRGHVITADVPATDHVTLTIGGRSTGAMTRAQAVAVVRGLQMARREARYDGQ